MSDNKAPSAASAPFKLIHETGRNDLPPSFASHRCCAIASTMAEFHNILIRWLNAAWLSSYEVQSSTNKASNLMLFAQICCEVLDTHHDWEENSYFPALETVAGKPGLFQGDVEQHHAFHAGLKKFEKYCQETTKEDFSSQKFRALIEAFAPALSKHLHEEPPTFLKLKDVDSDELTRVYLEQEKVVMAHANLQRNFPPILGCSDKTFHVDGLEKPPHPTPWLAPYLVNYVASWKYAAAWEFSPSDYWGNPKRKVAV